MPNYDPTLVQTIVDGHNVVGFAEDSMINAERSNDKREMYVSADGNVDFIENADDTGTVTITLKHTSPSNEKLQSLYEEGKEFEFSLVDQNFDGDVGASGSRCKVANTPPTNRESGVTENEWTLLVADFEQAFEGVA